MFISSYAGVTGTGLDLLIWMTTKLGNIYEILFSDTGQHRSVIPERRETKISECPGFFACATRKENPERVQRSHWVEETELEVWSY